MSVDFPVKKPKVDISKIIPSRWELPDEVFKINLPGSLNPTINLCDALVRKADMINDHFRGQRKPEFL
jgi:hypothetical protein